MLPTKSAVSLIGCALLAACGGAGTPTTTDIDTSDALLAPSFAPDMSMVLSSSVDTGTNDVDFATILNGLRSSRSLSDFEYDARLDAAAQRHAQDMVDRNYFSHDTLGVEDGQGTVYHRIVAEGYDPRGWAENLARGHQTQEIALQAWVDSPGHDANLNAPLEEFGLGVAGSGSQLTWVLVLGTEQ
ncbi:MAG: CAP domain-containing protein [Pseudomonadota bacterium]